MANTGFYNYYRVKPAPIILVILEKNVLEDVAVMRVMQERLGDKIMAGVITDVKDREILKFFECFTKDPKLVH